MALLCVHMRQLGNQGEAIARGHVGSWLPEQMLLQADLPLLCARARPNKEHRRQPVSKEQRTGQALSCVEWGKQPLPPSFFAPCLAVVRISGKTVGKNWKSLNPGLLSGGKKGETGRCIVY